MNKNKQPQNASFENWISGASIYIGYDRYAQLGSHGFVISTCYDESEMLKETIEDRFQKVISFGNKYIEKRIESHNSFITERINKKGPTKYTNKNLNVSVVTSQEKDLKINKLSSIKENNQHFVLKYKEIEK